MRLCGKHAFRQHSGPQPMHAQFIRSHHAEARCKQLRLLRKEPPAQLWPVAVRQPQHRVRHLRTDRTGPCCLSQRCSNTCVHRV